MQWWKGLTVVAVAVSCAAPLYAADSTSAKQGRGKEWAQELNLNADQKAKLKALRDEMKPTREASMEQMKVLRQKAKDELLKAAPSKPALDDIAKQMGAIHQHMAQKEQENLLKVKAVLSKEQFEKILMRDFERGGMQQKMGRGDHPHDGRPPAKPDDE